MARYQLTVKKILSGTADANVKFEELRGLLIYLGFAERIKGSHHIFRKAGVGALVNLQKDKDKAKPYQVKQVRNVLIENKLTAINDE